MAESLSEDEHVAVVRKQRWSQFNAPLFRAAVSNEDDHRIVGWLEHASHVSNIELASLGYFVGPDAVTKAWLSLKAGLCALGLRSRQMLMGWHAREGFDPDSSAGRQSAHVQVRPTGDAQEALNDADEFPPVLEGGYVAVVLHLARRRDIETLAADAMRREVANAGRVRGRRGRNNILMRAPPNAHVLDFDGAARGNSGPAGAGAILCAPAYQGGAVVWEVMFLSDRALPITRRSILQRFLVLAPRCVSRILRQSMCEVIAPSS